MKMLFSIILFSVVSLTFATNNVTYLEKENANKTLIYSTLNNVNTFKNRIELAAVKVDNNFEKPYTTQNLKTTNTTPSKQSNLIISEEFSYNISKNQSLGKLNDVQNTSTYKSDYFLKGLYYGFCFMVFFINVLAFFLFSDKVFLHQGSLVLSALLLFFALESLNTLFNLSMNNTLAWNTSLLCFLGVAWSIFMEKYLTLKEYASQVHKVVLVIISISLISLLFGLVTGEVSYYYITNVFVLCAFILYFGVGIYLFSKNNYSKIAVIGTFLTLLFAVDYFLMQPIEVSFLNVALVHVKGAFIVQALLLTYGVFYRMQSIKEGHLLRQAELRIYLRKQEALSAREKTEKLVEDIYLENLIMHYDLDGLEIKLLQYIAEGKDNAKIARKLKTTEDQIEELTKELYQKLEISEQIKEDHRLMAQQPDYIYN